MARTINDLQKIYNKKSYNMPSGHGPNARKKAEKPKNAKGTVSRLFKYVGKQKWQLLLVLVFMFFSTLTSLIGSYMLAPIIDRITLEVSPAAEIEMSAIEKIADGVIAKAVEIPFISVLVENGTFTAVTAYIVMALIILGAIYVISFISTYCQQRIMLSVSQNSVERIRNDLFSKLQGLPVRYFDSNSTGEIMSRFTNDVDNIDIMLNNSLTAVISGLVTLIGTFIFMVSTSWILTLVTIVFIPLFIKIVAIIGKKSQKYHSEGQAALGAVNGYVEETVSGAKVIKVFNHEKVCKEEFSLLNDDFKDKQMSAQFWGGIMGPIMGNTSQISYAATVGLGGILMCLGKLTPGALTIFANYSRSFSQPINQISMQVSTVFSAIAGAERVFAVMDETPEVKEAENDAHLEEIRGHVVFEDVTFGYDEDKDVLKNISLYAKPGQKVAFVGSTGAGKTTVTNLINRFYETKKGKITVDGVDIKDIPTEKLRENIAMVLQDTHLFTGTVMENIRYGRLDATDEEVIEAAKTASAHSFIRRLEHGYDTLLEGDGANLSQGQRQLINIARAAISKAPILILDEATSSVDTRTERHIEKGMDSIMKDRTTFVIAHRLSTVRNSNVIMVLEKGEIVERGDHDDLLAIKGRYYELYTGAVELD